MKVEKKAPDKKIIEAEIAKNVEAWDPHGNENATGDAFKTLFVARLVRTPMTPRCGWLQCVANVDYAGV